MNVRLKFVNALIASLIIGVVTVSLADAWDIVFDWGQECWRILEANISTPVWLSVVLGALSTGFLVLLIFTLASANKLREDVVLGIRWRWVWKHGSIHRLTSFCPKCNLQIHAQPALDAMGGHKALIYRCEDGCEFEQRFDLTLIEVEDLVKRKIRHRLQTRGG
jgi:hypothetical protein